jgi:hypothetical protein
LRGRRHEQTIRAVTGNDHLSVLSAFQDAIEGVQSQILSRPLFAVATHAGGLEKGENILVKRNALLIRSGRKFADINLADVPIVLRRTLSRGRKSGQQQSESGQSDGMFHFHIGGNITGFVKKARLS